MCTCCITWWPRHPVLCWIERSGAAVGYVTSRAHACLCVSWGLSRETSSKQRSVSVHSAAAVELRPLTPAEGLPNIRPLLPLLFPRSVTVREESIVTDALVTTSDIPLLMGDLPVCKWFVPFFLLLFPATLHRPPSSCCLSLHNGWLSYSFNWHWID